MFTDQRDLISVLSTIICKATLENAALTLPLYDEAAFVPSYPLMMRGRPPTNKVRFLSFFETPVYYLCQIQTYQSQNYG